MLLQAERIVSGEYAGNLQPFSAADYLTRFVPALAYGQPVAGNNITLGALLAALVILSALMLMRARTGALRFLIIAIGLPLLSLGVVSLFRNVFDPRYVLATAPLFLILFALAACQLGRDSCGAGCASAKTSWQAAFYCPGLRSPRSTLMATLPLSISPVCANRPLGMNWETISTRAWTPTIW